MSFFSQYSHQGADHPRSYHYVHKTSDGDAISFISVDACPDPGPKRPFNFFGVLKQVSLQYYRINLEQLEMSFHQFEFLIYFSVLVLFIIFKILSLHLYAVTYMESLIFLTRKTSGMGMWDLWNKT